MDLHILNITSTPAYFKVNETFKGTAHVSISEVIVYFYMMSKIISADSGFGQLLWRPKVSLLLTKLSHLSHKCALLLLLF